MIEAAWSNSDLTMLAWFAWLVVMLAIVVIAWLVGAAVRKQVQRMP